MGIKGENEIKQFEEIGNVIYDIGNRQCEIPKLQKLLDEILK